MRRLLFFFIKHKTIILDRLKNFLYVAALFVSCQQIIFAQNSSTQTELNEIDKSLNEAIFINTNSNSFLTGETLFYKISCINKTTNMPSKYSKIAYFDIIDSERKTIFSQKIFLENGSGSGDFFVPTTLETGTYKIVGYTRWMLNKNIEDYFTSDIFIINPYKETTTLGSGNASIVYESAKNDNISFDFKSKNFSIRNPVELKINANSDDYIKGNYTISVRKADRFASQNKLSFTDYTTESRKNDSENRVVSDVNFLLPELRGEIITGRIKSASQEIKNKNVALSIVGKNYDLKIVKTNDQGRFSFNIETPNSNKNIIIQLLEENKENYTIEIDKTKEIDFSKLNFSKLTPHAESDKNILERLVSSQIENAYYNRKKDSLQTPNAPIPFYGSLGKEYKFDDFTRFPTMEETITEIITGVVFRKDQDKYRIVVFDFDKNFDKNFESALPSLIMIDGLILEDLSEFFKYNPKNLDKVNVIKGLYYYGAKSFNGLICFTTKNGDYETNLKGSFLIKPELLRPEPKKEYFQPDYSKNKNARIPDYRHQLLWLPNADLSKMNSNIQFYTSDVSGKFEVILEGFSASGKPVFIKEIIDVKDNAIN